MKIDHNTGLIDSVRFVASPNCDERENNGIPEVVIIHCISLPPGQYGSGAVEKFFTNQLGVDEHPYYADIAHLTVSSHFLIQRDGELVQFVPTHQRAWHAGESACLGRPKVNDFSIGIELEGLDTDSDGFTEPQYESLIELIKSLRDTYPMIREQNLFAHSDIAPGRKPDPGPYFEWNRLIC